SGTEAALVISLIFIGFAIGAPFWGWLSDFIGQRKPLMFLGTILALLCLCVVIYSTELKFFSLVFWLFLFGYSTSAFFTSFAMIREVFPITLAATVLGIMNTFNAVCEALYEPLVGAFLDWTWDGKIVNGIHQFPISGYHFSLAMLPI